MAPKAAPAPAPAPVEPPKPACPPSPAKADEWWNYCVTKDTSAPVYVQPSTTLETALGIGAVAAAALVAIFAIK
jgi:hypothetical protein